MRLRARPTAPIPDPFANAAVQLLGTVEEGRRYAIARVDPLGVIERLRFVDVARDAARWAHLLRVRAVQPGERVLVLADRDHDWRGALLGVLEVGGVAVPCPGSLPQTRLRAIAADASTSVVLSPRPRPDLSELGASILSTDDLDARDAATAVLEMPHTALPDDPALMLYAGDASGAVHTHAALVAQASTGERWLGVEAGDGVWCTVAEGSDASVWLFLAAWHARAQVLIVEEAFDPEAALEVLHKLRPAAVWLSDDEYGALAATGLPPWFDLHSIRRALVTGEAAGTAAFRQSFGMSVEPIFTSHETGVVSAEPIAAAPVETASEPVADPDALLRDAEREAAEHRLEEERRRELAEAEAAAAAAAAAERRRRAEEAALQATREEERRRADEEKQRKRAEEDARRRAQREAKEREKQAARERAERVRRETEAAKQRERAEKEARRKTEQEAKAHEKLEARQRGAEEKRRERAEKEARRLAERQARECVQEEERLRPEEAKAREAAERATAEERKRADEATTDLDAARAQRDAAAGGRREEERRRAAADRAQKDSLAPDILSSITQYGATAPPVAERDDAPPRLPGADERRATE